MGTDFETYACEASPEVPRCSGPTLIRLSGNEIALGYVSFSGETHDWSSSHIAIKRSADQGYSWGPPLVLQPNIGRQNVNGPSLLRLHSGEILFCFMVNNSFSDVQIVTRRSADEMRSWSSPISVTNNAAYHLLTNHKAMQTSSGRILLPIFSSSDLADYKFTTRVHYSDDQGGTWKPSATELQCDLGGTMEPGIVELADGSLLMLIRTQLGFLYESRSLDDGATWTPPQKTDLVSPESSLLVTRLPENGKVLVLWNHVEDRRPMPDPRGNKDDLMGYYRQMRRSPLTAAVSEDGGRSWTNFRNLETRPDCSFAYPALLFVNGRAIICYWVYDIHTGRTSLKIRNLAVDWFSSVATQKSN